MSIRITVGLCRESEEAGSSISIAGQFDPAPLGDPATLQRQISALFAEAWVGLQRQLAREALAEGRSPPA